MKFDEDARLDTDQVQDQRARRRGGMGGMGGGRLPVPMGGKMAAGGGLGIVGVLLVVVLGMCSGGGGGGSIFGNTAVPGGGAASDVSAEENSGVSEVGQNCRTGGDAAKRDDCLVLAVTQSAQAFWADDLPRRQREYRPTQTVLFKDAVDTQCGPAQSAVGPFYCPVDEKVYLDLRFFDEFESRFGGKDSQFTKAYVIAHEYGHHVQNVLGISERVQRSGDRQGPESAAVRLELQADCLAGVWANNATTGPNPLITEITDQDIRDGLDAAAKVGDDYIQAEVAGQRVNPESWTHGSSEQRQTWFFKGFQTGDLASCDTFTGDI